MTILTVVTGTRAEAIAACSAHGIDDVAVHCTAKIETTWLHIPDRFKRELLFWQAERGPISQPGTLVFHGSGQ